MASFWQKWFGYRSARERGRSAFRPKLEMLEDRCLMTGGISDPLLVVPQPALALQPARVAFTDPAFGTSITRVSDSMSRGGFETQVYSQLQAFSTDSQYVLLTGSDGYIVRRLSDLSQVMNLDTSEWNAPRWHPVLAHTLVHFDTNADTDVTVQFTDVVTGITADVYTLPPQYHFIRGNQSFDELSRDGRWLAGMATRNDGVSVIFSLDLIDRQLGVQWSIPDVYSKYAQPDPIWGQVEPDWVGVSPLGRYMVVQWKRDGTAPASGLETFDIHSGAFVGRVYDGHQHGDMNVLPDGQTEVFMTFEIYHPSGNPWLGMRLLPGASVVSEPQYVRELQWGNGSHISGQGPDGVFLITAGSDPSNGYSPLEAELYLQYTDGRVLRLAHHRSTESDYWIQPRASISRDGRYVIFASDWGSNSNGRGDPYIIDLQGGSPPAPPPPPARPSLSIGDARVDEGASGRVAASFTVSLSAPSESPVTVRYATSDGTATAGSDYTTASGSLTFRPGETTKTITVWVRGDRRDEIDEGFFVNLTNATGADLADAQGEGTIIDDDPPPAIRIQNAEVTEGDAGRTLMSFTVRLSAASSKTITVRYATADSTATSADYLATAGTLTFQPGETQKTITVAVVGDVRDEVNETFYVNLSAAENVTIGAGQARGLIRDNDPAPVLSIANGVYEQDAAGNWYAVFTLSLSAPSGRLVTVNYATSNNSARAGRDYLAMRGKLTFQADEIVKTIRVPILRPQIMQSADPFYVNLSQPIGSTLSQGRATPG